MRNIHAEYVFCSKSDEIPVNFISRAGDLACLHITFMEYILQYILFRSIVCLNKMKKVCYNTKWLKRVILSRQFFHSLSLCRLGKKMTRSMKSLETQIKNSEYRK